MLIINKNPQVPKRFSSYISALDKIQEDVNTGLFYLLPAGILDSTLGLNGEDFFSVETTYNAQTDRLKVVTKYAHDEVFNIGFKSTSKKQMILSTLEPNKFSSYHVPFDENSLFSGDVINTVNFPLATIAPTLVTNFSTDYFSSIYINGTPQRATDLQISENSLNRTFDVSFSQVRGGSIFPIPLNKDKKFSSTPITGGTSSVWESNFVVPDDNGEEYINLFFDNLSSNTTPRILVVETKIGNATSYYVIPKDVFDTDTGLFYFVDENDSTAIKIKLSQTKLDELWPSNPILKFYFITPVEEFNPFSRNASFSRKYKLPYRNLVPNASSYLKLVAVNTITNTVTDIEQLGVATNNLYSIDYTEGILELFNVFQSLLQENTILCLVECLYFTPIQLDTLGDLGNTVSIYGESGTIKIVSNVTDLPAPIDTMYFYAYLTENKKNFSSVLNQDTKIVSVHQFTEIETNFIVSLTPITNGLGFSDTAYVFLGTLERQGPIYVFVKD